MTSAIDLPAPLMLADLGGTNARFACVAEAGADISPILRLATPDFATPEEAFARAILHFGCAPGALLIAGAGPRHGARIALTNADWVIDVAELAARFQCRAALFNDFEALALGLPFLTGEALLPIGAWAPEPKGVRLAVGPGTGCGVGALIEADGRFVPLASEGSHIGFGPLTREEERLFRQVERVEGRLTAEAFLSGSGLVRLHQARLAIMDQPHTSMDAAAITAEALAAPQSPAAATVRLFLDLLARFAGDMAISFRATGGVFIAGGIVPRLIPLLDPQAFRMNFEAKAPVESLAADCPTALIRAEAALIGLAAFGATPGRFLVERDGRIV